MGKIKNNKAISTKRGSAKNLMDLDYDFNTECGDGDIPDMDKPIDIANEKDKEETD